jgi:hypothetical protein
MPDDPVTDLVRAYDQHVQANRDQKLKIAQEALSRVRRALDQSSVELARRILDAENLFHPMHGESWKGWPE